MKIKVTYDKEDILKLIQRDLITNGLRHDLSTATYKGSATVTIEVEGTPSEDLPPVVLDEPLVESQLTEARYVKDAPAPTPPRETPPIEDEPVGDMRSILAQSSKNATDGKPMYNPEKFGGRPLMDGESAEWPGTPEPRSR